MVEVKGRRVDIIAVSVSEAYEDPDRAWWERLVFDVSEVNDKERIAKEVAGEIVETVREHVDDDEYYTEVDQKEDREAIEGLLLELMEEVPEEPERWMMVLPSETAYISVDFYTITKRLKEVVN